MSGSEFDDMPVIFRYTRAQAIEDGVLVDLTPWAKETGFKIPVACTFAVWQGWIVPPDPMQKLGQSERGRVHDLLWMLFVAIKRGGGGDTVRFSVIFQQESHRQTTVTFKAICGPGDQAEPVITIMLPDED